MKKIYIGDSIKLTDTFTGQSYVGVVTGAKRDQHGGLAVYGSFFGAPEVLAVTLKGYRYELGSKEESD